MKINHYFGGGVYAKETRIPAGQILVQHKHEHDHLSVLASGTVEVQIDGIKSRLEGPACITIKAGAHHGVRTLTDVVWYCIHATDCTDENQVDELLVVAGDAHDMGAIIEAMR